MNTLVRIQNLLDKSKALDFLGPLALRLYLVPVFWMAGMNKLNSFSSTADWFGNPDWGLGLPFPTLMAFLATSTELVGAVMLLFGFAVRWISIPLMFTMLIAIFTVHWSNGWQAVADPMSCLYNCADATDAIVRLSKAKEVLQENANYEWITGQGGLIISNNGIEWGATYFIMLLALFFIGAGKYASIDHWIKQKFNP